MHSPVVIGRDVELRALRGAIEDARVGQGSCLLLLGEAGSGKSRLLREARQEAAHQGMTVLTGTVPPGIAAPAFGVLAQALRSWTRSNPMPAAELASFGVGLHQVLPEWPLPPDPPDLTDAQMRLLILEGLLRLLLAAARNQGTVVILDDLHDADPETFDFLNHAAGAVADEHMLILGAVRTGEDRPGEGRARALRRSGAAAILELARLDEVAVSLLVEAMLEAPAPRPLIVDLLARTDGVPLLVEEMLAAYVAAGALALKDGVVDWSAQAAVVPETIVAIVRERLDRLAEDARLVLAAGAVLGRFDLAVLAVATGLEPGTLSEGLQKAAQGGLIEAGGGEPFRFRHALIRDSVIENLPGAVRTDLERRTAEALDSLHGEDEERLEERAQHWEAVGEGDRAARLFIGVGRRSLSRHAPASAEVALRRAIELARSAGLADEGRDVLVEALEALGRWEEALALDRRLLERHGEDARRLLRMARNAIPSSRLDEADALTARAVRAGADPARPAVLSALASLWRGDLDRAAEGGREALALAETEGEVEVICSALDVTGRAVAALGRFDEAAGLFRQWASLAARAGLKVSHLQALLELGNYEFLAGGPAEGLEAARDLAQEAGAYTTLVLADLSYSWWLRDHGRLVEALAVADEAVDLCRRFRLDRLPNALVSAGTIRNALSWDDGERLLVEGLALAPEDPDVLIVAESSRGETALRAGRFVRAEERLARAATAIAEIPSAVQGPAPLQRVGALLALGRNEEAQAALTWGRNLPAVGWFRHMQLWLAVVETLAAGSSDAFEEAAARLAGQASFQGAVALVLGAEVLGGPLAHEWLGEALTVFEAAGAADDAARVRQLLRDVPSAQRQRRTLMFTDIVGSTMLVEALGDEAWEGVLAWHDQTLRDLFGRHGGEEVKQVGDGFFVVFESPVSALACAVAIQQALARPRGEEVAAPRVRIGLHEAEVTRKARDYQGKGVHQAARIGALAEAGEIVASSLTVAGLTAIRASEPQMVVLKGIADPVEVVRISY